MLILPGLEQPGKGVCVCVIDGFNLLLNGPLSASQMQMEGEKANVLKY